MSKYTKKPLVFLYDYPREPNKLIGLAVSAWASEDFYESPDEMPIVDANAFAKKGLKAYHKTAIEYVNLVFVIKNVSRAFQQQLTRTRLASYSIQSMRVVTKEGFASHGHYTMPPSLTESQQTEFHNHMLMIEGVYEQMLKDGISAEDARSILPMCIHSDISMSIDLNALYHMLEQRFCVNTQWEYRQVASQMKQLVRDNLGELYSKKMDAPCMNGKCPMGADYCGTPVWNLTEEERIDFYKVFIKRPY